MSNINNTPEILIENLERILNNLNRGTKESASVKKLESVEHYYYKEQSWSYRTPGKAELLNELKKEIDLAAYESQSLTELEERISKIKEEHEETLKALDTHSFSIFKFFNKQTHSRSAFEKMCDDARETFKPSIKP